MRSGRVPLSRHRSPFRTPNRPLLREQSGNNFDTDEVVERDHGRPALRARRQAERVSSRSASGASGGTGTK
jgi:hypothetical protein